MKKAKRVIKEIFLWTVTVVMGFFIYILVWAIPQAHHENKQELNRIHENNSIHRLHSPKMGND